MRKIIIAVVALVVAAGAYYGLEVYPQQQFRSGLDQALATLPPGTTSAYRTAHYSVMSHQADVTGLTVHGTIPGNPPQPFDVTVDSIETTNPVLDFSNSWANAVANPAAYKPDTALPVADTVTMKGVTFRSAVLNVTEESIRIVKPRLFPWALLHDGMPSWQDLQASLPVGTQPARPPDLRPMLRAEAAVVLGIAYDTYEAGPGKVTETVPGIELTYNINKITGAAFDRGITREAAGEGITGSGNTLGTFAIRRVAIGATDVRAPMVRIINGEPLSTTLLDGMNIGRVDYEEVTLQPPGQPSINAGSVSIGPVVFTHGMPVSGSLVQKDFHLTRAQLPDPRAHDAFDKLGLDTVTVNYALAYDWDVPQRRVSVHDTMFKVNELGTITLSIDVTNVDASADSLTQARLSHARIRLQDASLVDRLMRAGAVQSGADPAAFRQQIAAMVKTQSDGAPVLQAAGQAVSDFIASPHSLTIELAPPDPVPFMALLGAMAAPAQAAAALGLKVTANQ